MEFHRKSLPEQHFLYVEREASMSAPQSIAEAMGSGFGAVFTFNQENAITPLSMPTAVYMDMPSGDKMTFRVGFFVSSDDAQKATGEIASFNIPAGDVIMTTHVGPYASLRVTHQALWDHVKAEGLTEASPVWEVYVDDPHEVAEDKCRTEIYRAITA